MLCRAGIGDGLEAFARYYLAVILAMLTAAQC